MKKSLVRALAAAALVPASVFSMSVLEWSNCLT